jgi:hypothetical protein
MPRRPTVVAIALAVALGSALPLHGGGPSARAALGAASGPLVVTDGLGAVLIAEGLRPGDSRAGEITVTNAGDTSGSFALTEADRVESPALTPPLSSVLDLTVLDLTAGRTVFAGKLGHLANVALGDFAQGEGHRYRFVVAFPAGRSSAADNPYQVVSTTVSYVWSAGPPQPAPPVATPPETATTPPASAAPPAISAGLRGRRTTQPLPTVLLTAARRQTARNGRFRVRLVCQARCRAWLSGRVTVGRRHVALTSISRSLPVARAIVLRLALPRRALGALSAGRRITVQVRVRASIGGRFAAVRRTVHLVPLGYKRRR